MGWTGRINRALARATGFELHRADNPVVTPPAAPAKSRGGAHRLRAGSVPWIIDESDEGLGRRQVPESPEGSAKASWFFDDYPRFYETSQISAYRGRLNLRYEAIFAQNRDLFEGARVLDITSHDGRWSLAALRNGAAEVIGIEANPTHVANAEENLASYGIEKERYSFITGDVFDVLADQQLDVDVVLCLGYLYHTLRYNELFSRIRALNPRALLIDTEVFPEPDDRAVVRLRLDTVGLIFDKHSYGDKVLVGWPSLPGLEMILRAYGFEIERLTDWGSLLRDNPDAEGAVDYGTGWRVTARCRSTSAT